MKAVRYHRHGPAELLRYEDADRPVPGQGQVLVRVGGTTFNPVDAAIRAGFLQQVFPLDFPHVPGLDVAGTVEQVGADVDGFEPGAPVIGFLPMHTDGATAEYVLAPAAVLTAAPSGIPLAQAAALPSTGLSAWQSLFELADLKAGQRLLVLGAGGAVGGYAVQLAHRAGAYVVASAGPRSKDALHVQGADEVVDRTTTDVAAAVTEPVDVVLNLAPLPDPAPLLGLLRPGGVLVTTVPPAPAPDGRDVRTSALFVRSDREQLARLVAMVDAGQLTVDVAETLPFDALAQVHARSEAGELHGKVVLTPPAARPRT
jgi:NADPH:quinone reductase-like Zn-dependent oxidoreductase